MPTVLFLAGILFPLLLWGAWDAFVFLKEKSSANTISVAAYSIAKTYPIIPALIGFIYGALIGHLFT